MMLDIGSIAAMISGLKGAADITKSIMELNDQAKINAKAIELQGIILSVQNAAMSAQNTCFTLAEENRELKQKLIDGEKKTANLERYTLKDFGGATYAYALKPGMANGEPEHRLCATCYPNGKTSVLQFMHRSGEQQDWYRCNECKVEQGFGHQRFPSSYYPDDD